MITDVMVERGGRALADWENQRERERRERDPSYRHVLLQYEDWKDEFDAQARAVLEAALSSV